MRKIFLSILGVFFAMSMATAENAQHSYVPVAGFVPDSATAIQIAKAIWVPIYGEKQIASEEPIRAELKNDTWYVRGSLPKGAVGGVAEAEISKKDGSILRVTHGK